MSSNPSLADSISSGNSRKENGKRKKTRASQSNESEKSSGAWALLLNYGGIFCLVVTFFIAGITVGSLLVESSGSPNGDVNAFPQSLTKKMLHSIDASSVQSVVSIKGHHLRKAEEIPSVIPPAPPSPFRDSHSADASSAVQSNHHPVPPSAAPPVEQQQQQQQQQHQLRGLPNLFSSVSYGAGSANAAAANAAEVVDDRRYSLHCQDEGYLILPNTAALDASDVLIAAWVYLDASESHDNDMRTIFSNKQPGCEAGAEQHGLAVFVNAWQSSDHKVYLEYGGERSGCNKLDSGSVTLANQRWYHVAVALTETHAAMFIDGALVNVQAVSDPHIVSDTASSSLVGRYAASAPYTLYGNVSTLAFVHHVSATDEAMPELTATVKQLQRLDTARHVPHLQALYSLQDAAYEKPNSIAVESSSSATANAIRGTSSKNGKYTFSSFGGGVAGVKFPLVTGVDENRVVTDAMRQASDKQAYTRRERIKEGMRHAWRGYKQYAWGNDELKPLSNRGQDNWGGMGVTLVDSLDTLWLMGLKAEFQEARDWVANRLTFDRAGQVSVFETTIRELGGLLAAYDFSQDRVFLDKARQLGDRLIRAFSASPQTGIPSAMLNMRTGAPANGWAGATAILSELGSLQLEFRYLGYSLGETSYETTSMKPLQVMIRKKPRDGLYPIKIHMNSGDFADSTVTFGALGDSFYEYLLKLWLQGGRKEMWLREAYDRAMNGAIERLLQASSPSGLAFFADWNGHSTMRKMDHLVCFVPGMLALGAYTDPLGLDSGRAQRDLAVAKAMMYTCREMYHRMQSGISAEYVEFPAGRDLVPGPGVDFYILRPETAESMFILHQLTGDPIYRDWAWEIFEAIEAHCKTSSGYASIRNVNSHHTGQDDRMESFFLAETMKYLYLAQDPDKPVDLMHMVFNTEAHPMRVFDANKHTPVPLN